MDRCTNQLQQVVLSCHNLKSRFCWIPGAEFWAWSQVSQFATPCLFAWVDCHWMASFSIVQSLLAGTRCAATGTRSAATDPHWSWVDDGRSIAFPVSFVTMQRISCGNSRPMYWVCEHFECSWAPGWMEASWASSSFRCWLSWFPLDIGPNSHRCMLSRYPGPSLLNWWAFWCSCGPDTASFLGWCSAFSYLRDLLLDWVCSCHVHLNQGSTLRQRCCLILWFLRVVDSVRPLRCQENWSFRWIGLSLSFTFRNSAPMRSSPSPFSQYSWARQWIQRSLWFCPLSLFLSQYAWDRLFPKGFCCSDEKH